MKFIIGLLISTFAVVTLVNSQNNATQGCSMRGNCGYRYGYLPVPCSVDELPSPVDSVSLAKLVEFCPELTSESGNSFCCTPFQIEELVNSMQVPQAFLKDCPACYHNFRQIFCHLACSPYQRSFLNVTETALYPSEPWTEEPLIEGVKTIEIHLTQAYVDRTYKSCQDVQRNVTDEDGSPVLIHVMDFLCGEWGALKCSGERLFDYLGSENNGYSPIHINFQYISASAANSINVKDGNSRPTTADSNERELFPFHYDTFQCNEVPENGSFACSCMDCPLSCSPTPVLRLLR